MPVISALRRRGAGIRSSSHPQLYRELEASLGYIYKPSKQGPSCPVYDNITWSCAHNTWTECGHWLHGLLRGKWAREGVSPCRTHSLSHPKKWKEGKRCQEWPMLEGEKWAFWSSSGKRSFCSSETTVVQYTFANMCLLSGTASHTSPHTSFFSSLPFLHSLPLWNMISLQSSGWSPQDRPPCLSTRIALCTIIPGWACASLVVGKVFHFPESFRHLEHRFPLAYSAPRSLSLAKG